MLSLVQNTLTGADIVGANRIWYGDLFIDLDAVVHPADTNFDLFVDAGALVAVAWASDSDRAVERHTHAGEHVGAFRTTLAGLTEDSYAKRFLAAPGVRKIMRANDAAVNWQYSTLAYRVAHGQMLGNSFEFLCLWDGTPVSCWATGAMKTSAGPQWGRVGIGLDADDTTTVAIMNASFQSEGPAHLASGDAYWAGHPGQGYHRLMRLECGAGADTQTWLGQGGTGGTTVRAGIFAEIG